MSPFRSAFVLPLLLIGCLHTSSPLPPHEYNNDLCAQEIAQGNYGQATLYCDLGLEFAPRYADLWKNKGLIAVHAGDRQEAKRCFIKAIRFSQEQATAHTSLGRIYLEEGDYARSLTQLQHALEVDPNHLEARYNLGLYYVNVGKLAEARKEFKTLLTMDPHNAQVHHDLGLVLYRQGDAQAAEQELLQTVHISPGLNAEWWNDLGAVQMELSRFTDAAQSFGSCLAIKPEHSSCQNNLRIARHKAELVKAGRESSQLPQE